MNRTRFVIRAAGFGVLVGLIGWGLRFLSRPPAFWPWLIVGGGGLVVLAASAVVRRPLARLFVLSAGLVAGGVWLAVGTPAETPVRGYWWPPVLVGGLVLALIVSRGVGRNSGSAGLIDWWSWRNRRRDGVASVWQIWRTSSAFAARRKARILRPSLRHVGWWRRWFATPIRELATPVARVGVQRVWSPVEDVTVRIGGPRTGKTGELAGRILDAPGAAIATSTRTDLLELTGPVRAKLGPIHVFNPCGLGDLKSTITFDPLSGCADPKTAVSRAADLLGGVSAPGSDAGDREFWTSQARRALAALMHAAALGDASMRDVLGWVANPDGAVRDVSRFLRRSVDPAWETDATQFLETNDRTRSSICATIMPALGWLTDATAAAAATGGEFDVADLLDTRGTVYLLGAEEAHVAPLVTALFGHIAREARRLAALQPGGRLDPPFTLAPDEAALICPIPLDLWTADMGGRNITIHIAAQSRAQLRARWGDTGAAAILNNAATLMIFGGTRDPEDLNAYSTLTGERWQTMPRDHSGRDRVAPSVQRVPVLSAGQIAQLPARRVVIIRRGMPPAIGRVQMAWKRHDVKAVARAARWAEWTARWVALRQQVTTQAGVWGEAMTTRVSSRQARPDVPVAPAGGDTVSPTAAIPRPRVGDAEGDLGARTVVDHVPAEQWAEPADAADTDNLRRGDR